MIGTVTQVLDLLKAHMYRALPMKTLAIAPAALFRNGPPLDDLVY